MYINVYVCVYTHMCKCTYVVVYNLKVLSIHLFNCNVSDKSAKLLATLIHIHTYTYIYIYIYI